MFETLWYGFSQSDITGKGIVVILMGISAIAWCIMINKLFIITEINRSRRRFRRAFEAAASSPLTMSNTLSEYRGPLKDMCEAGLEELKGILQKDEQGKVISFRHSVLTRRLSNDEIDKIRSTMNKVMSKRLLYMEDQLTMLGTIVATSPMLGLFGTVWGVMLTFIGIAKVGRPDLMAIAPGISGALLTTVAGLLVAIPSLAGNNFIIAAIQATEVDMETFCDEFITSLKLEETNIS